MYGGAIDPPFPVASKGHDDGEGGGPRTAAMAAGVALAAAVVTLVSLTTRAGPAEAAFPWRKPVAPREIREAVQVKNGGFFVS